MPWQLQSWLNPTRSWKQIGPLVVGLLLLAPSALAQAVPAQEENPELPFAASLDGQYKFLLQFPTNSRFNSEFESRIAPNPQVTDETTSSTSPTLPSLWWSRDQLPRQLGGNRLINSWLAYRILDPSIKVVDVMVNNQIWGILSYTEQYAVLNQFGSTAKDYGYNLRIFQGSVYSPQMLGMYVCDFGQETQSESLRLLDSTELSPDIPCQASLDMNGIQGFRGIAARSSLVR